MKHSRVIKSAKNEWKPVSIDPTLFGSTDLEGLIGVEELSTYSIGKANVVSKSKKAKQKVKKHEVPDKDKPSEKVKKSKKKKKVKNKKSSDANDLIAEAKPAVETDCVDPPQEQDDLELSSSMSSWNGLGVPSILLRALADKSFMVPTKIQALTLPPAIFGRRDILGAAETGSGKTLAFGLPILNGILQAMKNEKAQGEEEEEDILERESTREEQDSDDQNSDDQNSDDQNSDDQNSDDQNSDDQNSDGQNSDDQNSENDEDETAMDDDSSDPREDFDEFEGGAQCTKVIDNVKFDFPITESKKSKTCYVPRPFYALILTPTRELAVQIAEHLRAAAKYTSISVAVVVGGLSSQKQERLLNRGPSIVVATPGRLWDLIEEGHPHLVQVDSVKYLAIDETDRMLEKGHFEELQKILERVNTNENFKQDRQNFVFSATLTLTHEPPRYIAKKKGKKKGGPQSNRLTPAQKLASIMETVGLTDPKIVDITETSGVAQLLTEAQIICPMDQKDYYLYYFLQRHPGRTLVFCNSIEAVRRLTQLFSLLGCAPWPLHAKMHQKQRLKNLERFCSSPRGILLATDVAARGLDIPNIQHVIHYQTPRTAEGYVHRSGRTARAQQEGLTVLLIEPSEVNTFSRLFRTLGREANLPSFPVETEWMPSVKQRVDLARRLDKLDLQVRRINTEQGWFDKVVKEMDLEMSDEELPTSYSRDGSNKVKKQADVYRKQLSSLLAKPLFPKGFSSKYPTQTGRLVVPLFPGHSDNKGNQQETAVQALKNSVEEQKALKRKLNNERSKRNKKKRKLNKQEPSEEDGAPPLSDGESDDEEMSS